MPRCQGTTKAGSRCKLPTLEGEEFCRHHLPAHTTLEDFLKTRSLGQRIASIVRRTLMDTRRRLIFVGLVFVITFVFSRDNNYFAVFIEIPHEVIVQFFSALSQALAALLGLLIAFLVFRMQGVDQERNSAYREFKSEIRQLVRLTLDRPDVLEVFDDDLALIVNSFAHLRMENLPIQFSEYDGPSWEEAVSDFLEKWEKLNERMPWEARVYFEQIVLVLANVEDIFTRLGVQYIGIMIMRFTVDAITQLSLLLGTSLVLLLAFGTIDRQGVFPELRLSIIFAIVTWLLITLFDLIARTRRLYRNFWGAWEPPDWASR